MPEIFEEPMPDERAIEKQVLWKRDLAFRNANAAEVKSVNSRIDNLEDVMAKKYEETAEKERKKLGAVVTETNEKFTVLLKQYAKDVERLRAETQEAVGASATASDERLRSLDASLNAKVEEAIGRRLDTLTKMADDLTAKVTSFHADITAQMTRYQQEVRSKVGETNKRLDEVQEKFGALGNAFSK